jgi:hypothetical protein
VVWEKPDWLVLETSEADRIPTGYREIGAVFFGSQHSHSRIGSSPGAIRRIWIMNERDNIGQAMISAGSISSMSTF